MRRLFVLAALLAIVCCGKAQNVQLHYDFGGALYDKDLHGRPVLTSTVEMFKADKWGSTYFFVDMDYTSKGVAAGYWEIARELRFWQPPFSIHVEYNGGASNSFSYNNAYLGGATYTRIPLNRIPTIARIETGVNGPNITKVAGFGTMMPAFFKPTKAMNMPIPAEIAKRRFIGMLFKITSRTFRNVIRIKITPSTNIAVIAVCQE